MQKLKYLLVASITASILGLAGCAATVPEDALRLSDTALQDRQMQTRFFETESETELLSAGISVLQDMGYSIDETEKNAGVVIASKTVDAKDKMQIAGAVLIALLGDGNLAFDTEQTIEVSFVTTPSKINKGYLARVSFQRVVVNNQGAESRVETLKDEDLYTEFFDKLSKSVFLEAHNI